MSSGTVAVLVGRTGMMVKVPVPVAVQGVPAAMVLHGSAGSATETVTDPEVAKSSALRRRRAPVEQGVVVEQVVELEELELEEAGTGKRTLIWPEPDFFILWTLAG
jgi:hypothetical protein